MRNSTAFSPSVEAFEGRTAPSTGVIDPDFAATGRYADAGRLGLHQQYVSEAEQGPGRLVFLGDSITYFWGTPDRVAGGSARWNATFGPLGAKNFGIIGDQTQNLLWRVENGELSGRPRVAVVLIGINDIIGQRSAKETAVHIRGVIRAIEAESPRTRVLAVGILPTLNPFYNAKAGRINAMVADQPNGPNVRFLDATRPFFGRDGWIRENLYDIGGIHLNAAGYNVLANTLIGPVSRLLRG